MVISPDSCSEEQESRGAGRKRRRFVDPGGAEQEEEERGFTKEHKRRAQLAEGEG